MRHFISLALVYNKTCRCVWELSVCFQDRKASGHTVGQAPAKLRRAELIPMIPVPGTTAASSTTQELTVAKTGRKPESQLRHVVGRWPSMST